MKNKPLLKIATDNSSVRDRRCPNNGSSLHSSRQQQRSWLKYSIFLFTTLDIFDGVPIYLHILWPAFALLSFLVAVQISVMHAVYSLILTIPVLFITMLFHELCHVAMASYVGGYVCSLTLWPLGGLGYISYFGDINNFADALIAVAGPLSHVPQCMVWLAATYLLSDQSIGSIWKPLVSCGSPGHLESIESEEFWASICSGAAAMQLVLFMANLIPAYPMDGGRLMGALLTANGIAVNRRFQIMALVGGVCCMLECYRFIILLSFVGF